MSKRGQKPAKGEVSHVQLAEATGMDMRTIERWRWEDGAPVRKVNGRIMWRSLKAVEAWRAGLEAKGRRIGTGAGRRGGKRPKSEVLAAPMVPDAFQAQLRAAATPAELLEAMRELTTLTIAGSVSASAANATRQLIEMQLEERAKLERRVAGKEALVSEEAVQLAARFDVLVSDARRAKVVALLAQLLEEEGTLFPSETPATAVAQLEAEGLDAFGQVKPAEPKA